MDSILSKSSMGSCIGPEATLFLGKRVIYSLLFRMVDQECFVAACRAANACCRGWRRNCLVWEWQEVIKESLLRFQLRKGVHDDRPHLLHTLLPPQSGCSPKRPKLVIKSNWPCPSTKICSRVDKFAYPSCISPFRYRYNRDQEGHYSSTSLDESKAALLSLKDIQHPSCKAEANVVPESQKSSTSGKKGTEKQN